jgi:succinyl-CoA synthetase beta subunit
MNIHEFQAKLILQKYGIPVPEFFVVSSPEELKKLLKEKGWESAVLKVQVHAGGRGKAGGVKIAHSPQQIVEAGNELFGKKIVNEQTGSDGLIASKLLVSPLLKIDHEYYLGITINREKAQILLLASPVGGMDIEQVAQEQPEKLLIIPLPSDGSFRSYHLNQLANFMRWRDSVAKQGNLIVKALVRAFIESDASLLEINPLIKTPSEELFALDAKLVIDDNGLFRQSQLKALLDPSQLNPIEARALKYDLAYVALDGNIGCMVNGAGLAMATMDLIHHFGGSPANFLDVGGGATNEKVAEGFKILLSDPKVKAIFVNIFGGIMSCETLAAGIISASKDLHIHVPLIVRLEGTDVEKGKNLLEESGLNIISISDLTEAAKQAVKLAAGV